MTTKFKYPYAPISGKLYSRQHLKALYHFRHLLQENILGEQDQEWRAELLFILGRTNQKIRQVEGYLLETVVV